MNTNVKIKAIRKALRLTQVEFSAPLRVAGGYISAIESGGKEPSETLITLLRQYYRISDTWWETGEGEMFEPKRPPEVTNLSYAKTGSGSVKEAALEYFKQCGIMPSVAEQVIEELAKLDKGHQLIEAGKIINDVADILEELDRKGQK